MSDRRRRRERAASATRLALTEPGAIAWPLPLVLAVAVLLDQVLGLGALGLVPRRDLPLGTRLAVVLTGVIGVSLALGLGRLTWLRTAWARRHPSLMVATIVAGAQVGLINGRRIIADAGLPRAAEVAVADELVLLVATTVVALVVLGALRRHRAAMGELGAAGDRLRTALTEGTTALVDARRDLRERVRILLEERLGPTSLRAGLYAPARLRALADEVLRPLSHQLALTRTGFEPSAVVAASATPWRRVLRSLRPEPVVRPRLLAAAMLLLTFRLSVREGRPAGSEAAGVEAAAPGRGPGMRLGADWTSLGEALLQHVAVLVVVLVGARLLARWLGGRDGARPGATSPTGRWAAAVLGLGVLGLGALGLLRAVHLLPGFGTLPPVDARVVVGFTVPIVLVTGIVSLLEELVGALERARNAVGDANEEVALAVARVNGLLAHERTTFARHLHSSVQAAVNAAAIMLERATVDGQADPRVVERAAATIDAAIDRLLAPEPAGVDVVDGGADADAEADLDQRLAAVRSTWEDVADVTIDLDPTTRSRLASDPVAVATVGDLVAEACANAVVHGLATRVTVRLRVGEDDRALELTVVDDGTAEHTMRREGLGSRTLTDACTRWSLDHGPTGTTLSASLPVR